MLPASTPSPAALPRPRAAGHQAEIRAITGLRGVAAVLVAGYHFTDLGLNAPALIAPVLRRGYLAVDLFFVLSGFVMALTYGRLFDTGHNPYRWFLGRRLWRIYPLYALCVLATFGLVHAGLMAPLSIRSGSWPRFGIDLLMLQSLGAGPSLLPVTWSLSTEWIAYLAFPVLARAALHRSVRAAWSLGGLCVFVLLGLCLVPDTWLRGVPVRTLLHQALGHVDTATPFPLLRCVAGFCLGMLAWRASCSPRVSAVFDAPASLAAISILCVGALCVPGADLVAVPSFACLLVCLAAAPNPPRAGPAQWLGSAPAHWLGEVSYPLYLTHLLLWQMLHPWLDHRGLPRLSLFVPTLLFAGLCHWMIELPATKGRKRFFLKKEAKTFAIKHPSRPSPDAN